MAKIIILSVIVIFIIWYTFIRKPYIGCRWYQHRYGDIQRKEKFYDTNKFVGETRIREKRTRKYIVCEKCFDKVYL